MAQINPSRARRKSSFDLGSALFHHKFLSPFQVEKLCYMFKAFFDMDANNYIDEKDVDIFAEKIKNYAGFSDDDAIYRGILDVLRTFLDCLKEQVLMEKTSNAEDEVIPTWDEALKPNTLTIDNITLNQWLNMWGRLCHLSAGLGDFPCWAQLLPSLFFRLIDVDRDNVLSVNEYRRFYKDFIGIPEDSLDKVVEAGYKAMTADGAYQLTLENFSFCFANFLLGRNIYGPGKYIFGVFDNRDIDETFQVVYNEEDED